MEARQPRQNFNLCECSLNYKSIFIILNDSDSVKYKSLDCISLRTQIKLAMLV